MSKTNGVVSFKGQQLNGIEGAGAAMVYETENSFVVILSKSGEPWEKAGKPYRDKQTGAQKHTWLDKLALVGNRFGRSVVLGKYRLYAALERENDSVQAEAVATSVPSGGFRI